STSEETQCAHDEKLAALLVELTRQFHAGQPPDFELLAQQHPDLACELRELWPAVLLTEEMAKTTPPEPACQPSSRETAATSPGGPPRSFGDYELLEEIGRGGMGVVFKARQRSLDRVVAIKMVLRGNLASDDDLARFRA